MLRRKKSKSDVVRDRAADFSERATVMAGKAAENLAPKVNEARAAAELAYESANTRVREDLAPRVRDELVPAVAASLGKTRLADTRLAETRFVDVPKKKKGSKLKKLLIVTGLGGAAFFVARKLQGESGGAHGGIPQPAPAPMPTTSRPASTSTTSTTSTTAGSSTGTSTGSDTSTSGAAGGTGGLSSAGSDSSTDTDSTPASPAGTGPSATDAVEGEHVKINPVEPNNS